MPDPYDVVIAGAGLAGATAAYHLAATHRVLVLEADTPAAGASGIAPGIANPLMSLWARPVWRMEAAMEALEQLIGELRAEELVQRDGLLRPAGDARQAGAFAQVAQELPAHAEWLDPQKVAAQYPAVSAPFGALWNPTAVVVRTAELVQRLLHRVREQGSEVWSPAVVMDWETRSDATYVRVHQPSGDSAIPAKRLLLAIGREYVDFPALTRLRLHGVKGQLVRIRRPPRLDPLPHLAGRGYVLVEEDALILGSSYQHRFCDLQPDPDLTRAILQTTAEMIPAVAGAEILEERTGVRVTVPGIRLPMVGPLPDAPPVWVFTGLGSKGLLMAPMLARALPTYLSNPASIPADVSVRLARPASEG